MAVDQKSNKHQQACATIALDLANEEAVHYLLSLLKQPGRVFYVHAALPRGTCARTKERKLKRAVHKLGVKEPQALRNAQFPHGVPGLTGTNLKRVLLANRIYANLTKVLEHAIVAGAYVSIENPTRSLVWHTEWVRELIQKYALFAVTFQQCMHGGKRDQWSTFYTNAPWLRQLEMVCDGNHNHAPWGVTKDGVHYKLKNTEDSAYPPVLCERIAAAAHQAALNAGIQAVGRQTKPKTKPVPSNMAAAGWQPRGNRFPEVISEYKSMLTVTWPFVRPSKLPKLLTQHEASQLGLPVTTKVLTCEKRHGPDGEDRKFCAKLGILRTEQEFVEEALKLQHPLDSSLAVEDEVKANIFELLTEGPDKVMDKRQTALKHYANRMADLQEEEEKLHAELPVHRQRLVAGKNVLLLAEMCRDANIPDTGLIDLQLSGTSLTGISGVTGLFPPANDSGPAMDEVQLMKSSRWSRKMIAAKGTNMSDRNLNSDVWDITMEEVRRGWLQGPLDESEVRQALGPLFVVSPRFGLRQADKLRPIDDMSISLVNSSFSASYTLELDGVDGVAVLARTFAGAVSDDRNVSLELRDGEVLQGKLHSSLSVDDARSLMGRTLDLDAAYKQLLVRQSSLWASVLQVRDPQGVPKLFISHALPFGASASVYSFNRFSRALQLVGARLFSLVWTCYFDDFTQFDLAAMGDSSQSAAERFLDMVGWKFSMKESKRKPMAKVFSVLGVEVDLVSSKSGLVMVRNKKSRVEQIRLEIQEIINAGSFSTAAASSLRGRLQFAESQTFGRAINLFMRACNSRATGTRPGAGIDEDMLLELKWAQKFVSDEVPRVLKVDQSQVKVLIFTDACLEDNDTNAGVGMVAMVCREGAPIRKFFFSEKVPQNELEKLQVNTTKVIAGLELLAAVMAISLLKDQLMARRVFLFIDNEAARASLISMWSPIFTHARLLSLLWDEVRRKSIFMWTSRVPSMSNIADKPSRLEVVQLLELGFTRLHPRWP